MLIRSALIARRGHSERRRKRRSGMAGAITVVLALRAKREPIQTVRRADRMKTVTPARQNLVDVTLMAHIPDKFVFGRGKDAMQCERQLDDPEVRPEMAAVLRQLGDQLLADFLRERRQLLDCELLQLRRAIDHIQV